MIFLLSLLIICGTMLFMLYMYFCYESGDKMFESPHYNERISQLEKRLDEIEYWRRNG